MSARCQGRARPKSFAYGIQFRSCERSLVADSSQRNFKFIGIVGFVSILQSTWENTLLASYYGLLNGGTAGIIYCTIGVWIFMMCMIASMYASGNFQQE